jgi:hypothetical protein
MCSRTFPGRPARDTPTLLASYLRKDAETIMQVVLNPTMRLAAVK